MIIAIDFDQTFTADPNMWAGIIEIMNDHGHRVICVTCRPEWDTAGMEQIEKIIGPDNIFFTDNEAKIPYMEGRCHVDCWIDDTPATITGGGAVMYKGDSDKSNPVEQEPLDARFVLVSFYNRCTQRNPCWEVYGHIHLGHNEKIGSYKTKQQAISKAMQYSWIGVPVIAGSRGNYEPVLRKILNKD